MSPIDGGFLRLDTQTGAVALCAKADAAWTCNPVDDKSTSGDASQVAKLESENHELKDRVKALEDQLDAAKSNAPLPHARVKIELPSEAEVDQALDFMERMFKKIRERVRDLDKPLPPNDVKPDKQAL
jgi:hypothetical protein